MTIDFLYLKRSIKIKRIPRTNYTIHLLYYRLSSHRSDEEAKNAELSEWYPWYTQSIQIKTNNSVQAGKRKVPLPTTTPITSKTTTAKHRRLAPVVWLRLGQRMEEESEKRAVEEDLAEETTEISITTDSTIATTTTEYQFEKYRKVAIVLGWLIIFLPLVIGLLIFQCGYSRTRLHRSQRMYEMRPL